MSIEVMSRVWKYSSAKDSALLVMLAIADCAKDTGEAFPSISELGAKARIADRTVQIAVRSMVDAGELEVHPGAGPHRVNLYRIVLEGADSAPREFCTPQNSASEGAEFCNALNPVLTPGTGTINRKRNQNARARTRVGSEPKRPNRVAQVFDAFKARGITAHLDGRDIGAINKSDLSPELIVEIYAAILSREYDDSNGFMRRQLSVWFAISRANGYLAWKSEHEEYDPTEGGRYYFPTPEDDARNDARYGRIPTPTRTP